MTKAFHCFFKRIFSLNFVSLVALHFSLFLFIIVFFLFTSATEARDLKNFEQQKYYYFPQGADLFYLRYNFKNIIGLDTIVYKSFTPLGHKTGNYRLNISLPTFHGSEMFYNGITDRMVEDMFHWQLLLLSAYYKVFDFIVHLNPLPDLSYMLMAHNPAHPYLRSSFYYPLFIQLGVIPYKDDFKVMKRSIKEANYGFGFRIQFNPEDYISKNYMLKRRNVQRKTTRR